MQFVCRDLWQPHLKLIAKNAWQALHILDGFHIIAKPNKSIDEMWDAEVKELDAKSYEPRHRLFGNPA